MENITAPAQTRYAWIDLAKALSITLIVWFHCPPKIYPFTQLSIPLFFFLSGLLFDFEKYPSFIQFVQRRSKQLLVPYFCFFAMFYLFWLFVGRSLSSPEEQAMPLYAPLLEYLYGRPHLIDIPLWFVACLFAMQCIFYVFKNLHRNAAVIILLLLPFLPDLTDMSNAPWMLDALCYYFPFYGMASLFKNEIFIFLENKKRFLFVFILLIISILSSQILIHISNEYFTTLLKLILSFSLILPFVVLTKVITGKFGIHYLLKYIAANTLIILACHTYVIRLAGIFITQVLGLGSDFYDGNLWFKSGLTIFVMVSMFVAIYIINRYFPFIIAKGKIFSKKM